jgi:hypothetical protein
MIKAAQTTSVIIMQLYRCDIASLDQPLTYMDACTSSKSNWMDLYRSELGPRGKWHPESCDHGLGDARASYGGLRVGTAVRRRLPCAFHEWSSVASTRRARYTAPRARRPGSSPWSAPGQCLVSMSATQAAHKLATRATSRMSLPPPNTNKFTGSGTPRRNGPLNTDSG